MKNIFPEINVKITENALNLTPLAGLFPLMDMWNKLDLDTVINEALAVRKAKGYVDAEHIQALTLMQLAGGEALEHLINFKENVGAPLRFMRIPSPSAARSYLASFHDETEDLKRGPGKSYIVKENGYLKGFNEKLFPHLFKAAHKRKPLEEITLDQDATFIYSNAEGALYNYEGKSSFEALNLYCPEYDVMVQSNFRDGNVNPGYGQLGQLQKALSLLPKGITKVKLRSDSAGYQKALLKFCAEGKDERFGVIDFAISCPVGKEFKEAVKAVPSLEWKPLSKGQEWAEISYAPNSLSTSRKGGIYRFLAIREPFKGKLVEEQTEDGQLYIEEVLEDILAEKESLKQLHLTAMNGSIYKIFGIVTNILEEDGGEIIHWNRGRCGKSEEVHLLLKEELGGGHVVSKRFGANAAWWYITVFALSLNNIFKQFLLPPECRKSRIKTLRFKFYNIVGNLIHHARQLTLKLSKSKAADWFLYAFDHLKSFNLHSDFSTV